MIGRIRRDGCAASWKMRYSKVPFVDSHGSSWARTGRGWSPQRWFRISGFLFPVLHRGPGIHSRANDGSLPDIRYLFRRHLPEILNRPDVVFHLSLRAGAADDHMYASLAQRVPEAFAGAKRS